MQRRGLCYHSVHGYVQTRDPICFVCYSFSFSDLRKPRCVLIRVWLSGCDGCQLALLPLKTVMKMFQPSLLSLSESVDSLSANCNTCPLLLPHSHFQHHFYLLFHPLPPHLVPSNPLAPFLFTLPLCCVLAQVGYLWKYILFLFSRLKLDLLNQCGNRQGLYRQQKAPCLHYLGSVSQVHIGNGWLS